MTGKRHMFHFVFDMVIGYVWLRLTRTKLDVRLSPLIVSHIFQVQSSDSSEPSWRAIKSLGILASRKNLCPNFQGNSSVRNHLSQDSTKSKDAYQQHLQLAPEMQEMFERFYKNLDTEQRMLHG